MLITDIVLSVDLSGSFSDDLPNWQAEMPTIVNRLTNPNLAPIFGRDVKFGLTSFVDKPISTFGDSGDYVYDRELALTNNISDVKTKIKGLTTYSGDDLPEAQLEALMHTALDSGLGYRSGSSRIAILATDAAYHKAGDGLGVFPITGANDGDNIVEADEDYPDIAQVKTALDANKIIPVFLVTNDQKSTYDGLVSDLGQGIVLDLATDSENIADAIKFAVAQANDVITIKTASDGTPIGDGDDTIVPVGVAGDQVVFAGGGDDGVILQFTPGNHYIDGGAGFDVLYGGIGQDTVDGGSSNDNLVGGEGNDQLFGSSGDDLLTGGAGDDYLQGDSGNDVLTGGAGADNFGFATGTSFDINDLGVDTIQDFSTTEGDKIQLSQFTFDALSSSVGILDSVDFGSVGSAAPITYDSSNGDLFYQGTPFATFTGNPTLSASDFEVVNF